MASVRVFYKKQVRIDQMNFRQQSMFKIGTVGVAAVKNRLAAAQGSTDSPAKPLTRRYAIQKTKLGRGNPSRTPSVRGTTGGRASKRIFFPPI